MRTAFEISVYSSIVHLETAGSEKIGSATSISQDGVERCIKIIAGAIRDRSIGVKVYESAKEFLLTSITSENEFLRRTANSIIKAITNEGAAGDGLFLDHEIRRFLSEVQIKLLLRSKEVSNFKNTLDTERETILDLLRNSKDAT
jgi:hypothetical protein